MIDPTLPLVDLHRHLDGSVRLETILELGLAFDLPLPAETLEGLRPYVQVTSPQPGLLEFFTKFEWLTKILVNYDVCRRIAYENVEDARREGIDYIELRFSPWFMAQANHLDPAGVTEAVIAGVREGERDFDIRANLIGILSRTFGAETCMKELQVLLGYRDQLAALDLAGDEIHFPAELFVEHFKKGREAGWHITVHAGEAAGPENIWQALRLLGAERIGHATRALEDMTVVDYMAEKRIGVEMNLTSNVQISAVPDYASHPLKTFLERGLLATINTDDPGISAITLRHEYEVAAPAAGLSQAQIRQAQQNALEIAFLSAAEKEALRRAKN